MIEIYFNDFMELVKMQTKKENIIKSKKNWVLKNKSYFNNYYHNNTKEKNYCCLVCNKNYNMSHKARHEKTEKHIINLKLSNINFKQ